VKAEMADLSWFLDEQWAVLIPSFEVVRPEVWVSTLKGLTI
jgi:hypothetical protein